jgi:hypothetical protein
MTKLFVLVFAMLDHGSIGFGLHAAHYASAAECVTAGNKVLKESIPENLNIGYACYDLMAPQSPAIAAGIEPK